MNIPSSVISKNLCILAVDDDESFLATLAQMLGSDYDVTAALGASGAMKALKERDFDCILLDMKLPEIDGLQLLKIFRGLKPHIPIVMLTGDKTPSKIVKAIKDGASDYVVKEPSELEAEVKFRVERAIGQQNLLNKTKLLEKKISQVTQRYEIVGLSTATLKLKMQIAQLKGHHTPILVQGESGTGKELVARAINTQEVDGASSLTELFFFLFLSTRRASPKKGRSRY